MNSDPTNDKPIGTYVPPHRRNTNGTTGSNNRNQSSDEKMKEGEDPKASTTTATTTTTTTKKKHLVDVDDDTEKKLGISVYLSPRNREGFSAVLKARYSDFVVHEVGQDGRVARLDSMNATILSADDEKQQSTREAEEEKNRGDAKMKDETQEEEEDKASEDVNANSGKRKLLEDTETSPPEPAWEELQKNLADIVKDPDAAGKVIQFLKDDDATNSKEEEQEGPTIKKQKNDDETFANNNEGDTKKEGNDYSTKEDGKNESNSKEPKKECYYVCLPPIQDKDARRKVHEWVRSSSMNSVVVADTGNDDEGNKVIRFWPRRHEKKMPNYGKFDKNGRRAPKHGGRVSGYLQFVLYKENCDTNTAVKQITQRMGQGGRGGRGRGRGRGGRHNNNRNDRVRVGYAGMKDKRGVTTQFMTLHQRSPNEITWVNQIHSRNHGGGNSSKGGIALVRVGNFREVKEELRLGRLKGNRFDVVLRNIKTSNDHTLEMTKEVVSKSAEALKKNGFINYFGTQRFGKFKDTHLSGMAFLKGDFEKSIEFIMRPKEEGEKPDILEARQKWARRFSGLKDDTQNTRARAEAACAKQVLKSMGRFMANEVSVLESLSRNPLDYKRAFSSINKTMRMMFVHAVQSLLWNKIASHRIEKMGHEVLVGDLVFTDDNASQTEATDSIYSSAVKHVTEADVTAKKYTLEDVVLPLLGTLSKLPNNDSGNLFQPILKELGLAPDIFEKVQDLSRDITCPGDYRKLICRPSDVDFSIVEYSDPYQPLLQTDLMSINGVQVLENSSNNGEGADGKDKRTILGMVVGFTLPSSAYATIALRELMKKPTSTDYQRELDLGGPAPFG